MVKIGCIQPQIFESKSNTYAEIERLLKLILETQNECDIICLPERWVPLETRREINFQEERGKNYLFIKRLAHEYCINIISGAIWEKRKDNKKPHITSYVFNSKGEEIGRQDKIHLYSYEREEFEPSNELKIFTIDNCKFAVLICFDMAFFETPRLAVEYGANILFSPTQIRMEGMENWEIYLKCRALENRIPIAACNTVGSFLNRNYIGSSKIISFIEGYISPSKLKVVEAPANSSGYAFDNIDLEFPKKIRKLRLKQKIEKNNINIQEISS